MILELREAFDYELRFAFVCFGELFCFVSLTERNRTQVAGTRPDLHHRSDLICCYLEELLVHPNRGPG